MPFPRFPTECLRWLAQTVEGFEFHREDLNLEWLEEGLCYWADKLTDQLRSIPTDDGDEYSKVIDSLGLYCQVCLELCDDLMECAEDNDYSPRRGADWNEVLEFAASAFKTAEGTLDRGLPLIMA